VSYSRLDHQHLIATVGRLHDRIAERFPDAGLRGVAAELRRITAAHAERTARIRRPAWRLRLCSALLLSAGIGLLAWLFAVARADFGTDRTSVADALQSLEAVISMLFFLGAGAVYVASLELRSKRRRCLEALHELRALAHIVDMHQLTKDPEHTLHPHHATASSPKRQLSPFLLTRYLDYCAELLALIGKIGALYAQDFPDPQAVDAVDDIEDLTSGLSGKIWQKIMILANHPGPEEGKA
jgi:hypothetical protein